MCKYKSLYIASSNDIYFLEAIVDEEDTITCNLQLINDYI